MCVGTKVCGHKRVWAQTCLGTNVFEHKCVWAQACLGTSMSGHKRVWAQTCVDTDMWSQSCGHKRGGTKKVHTFSFSLTFYLPNSVSRLFFEI